MRQAELPPGTLLFLLLNGLARSGELRGYEIANSKAQTLSKTRVYTARWS